MPKNKFVVYTCITGNYDTLLPIKNKSKYIDYICFTDNSLLKSDDWEIRPLPKFCENLSLVKQQRLVKILAHKLFSEYLVSLWIDGNIRIEKDLYDTVFSNYNLLNNYIFVNKHPCRNCIYDEANAVIQLHKDSVQTVSTQIQKYISEQYPKNNGLAETNVLLRRHNNVNCIKLMNLWAKELLEGSHRDQLSFDYCCSKLKIKYDYLNFNVRDEKNKIGLILQKHINVINLVENKSFETKEINLTSPKIVIYTCLLKNYDTLVDVSKYNKEFDFICFTDNLDVESNGWQLLPMPNDVLEYSTGKQQRLVKMLPHLYLPEKYDISLYIDSNLKIISRNLRKNFFNKYPLDKEFIYIRPHTERDCLYDESIVCKQKLKDDIHVINKQIEKYKNEGFPSHFGLFENGILLRKHKDENCIKLMNLWADELKNGSKRDQLSLTYCQWKLGAHIGKLNEDIRNLRLENNFRIVPHNLDPNSITICTCNFNGTKLTNACVKSIIKNCGLNNYKIIILDNSDKDKFILDSDIDTNIVEVLDNTNGQYINFNEIVKKYGGKIDSSVVSGYANLKHSYSIQFLLNISKTANFILFDNDTILKKKIDFIDNRYISISGFQHSYIKNKINRKQRFLPFIQYFNKNLINIYKVNYFNSTKIMNGNGKHSMEYDTGASFTEAIINKALPFKIINVADYIEHLMGASWAKVHDEKKFLEENKKYYS